MNTWGNDYNLPNPESFPLHNEQVPVPASLTLPPLHIQWDLPCTPFPSSFPSGTTRASRSGRPSAATASRPSCTPARPGAKWRTTSTAPSVCPKYPFRIICTAGLIFLWRWAHYSIIQPSCIFLIYIFSSKNILWSSPDRFAMNAHGSGKAGFSHQIFYCLKYYLFVVWPYETCICRFSPPMALSNWFCCAFLFKKFLFFHFWC
jgi:hypothetical protein